MHEAGHKRQIYWGDKEAQVSRLLICLGPHLSTNPSNTLRMGPAMDSLGHIFLVKFAEVKTDIFFNSDFHSVKPSVFYSLSLSKPILLLMSGIVLARNILESKAKLKGFMVTYIDS